MSKRYRTRYILKGEGAQRRWFEVWFVPPDSGILEPDYSNESQSDNSIVITVWNRFKWRRRTSQKG